MEEPKLIRPKKDRVVAGVCLALANYFKVDVVIVRIVFIIMALGKGAGVLIYIVLMIAIPEEDGKSYADDIKSSIKAEDKAKIKEGIKKSTEKLVKATSSNQHTTELLAGLLIAIGGIFLLSNIAPAFFSWDKVWPLLLVFLGIAILASSRKKEK